MNIIHKTQMNMARGCGNYSPIFAIDVNRDDLRARAVFVNIMR